MRVSGHGLSADLPPGWEGEISRPEEEVRAQGGAPVDRAGRTFPVAHLANFALPAGRGDYGGGVVEVMRRSDVFVALLEFGPECAGTALFSAPRPRRLSATSFSPRTLHRTVPGHAGHQTFFTDAGRAFCLYVVIGDRRGALGLAAEVNRVLPGIRIGNRS